ncbi:hypothetical protein [Bradyrhizobium zhanjiangense]|uniref:Uncharacterized protein n=1 Tax=Bradyrhizobium zhanjiangense TaxID=1325107 RepID=A0A4Q0RWR4_9BRAD|nr:hypothetical protein [Bradyrhizobium zhanjiangense]RXH24322.1 hypothetical protein XH94_36285 [Bradyrhizobium zhanjiangense]
MTDTSATIIDFNAYEARKHAAAERSRGGAHPMTLEGELVPFYLSSLFLTTWIQLCLLALPSD